MMLDIIVIRSLTSHPYKAGAETPGFAGVRRGGGGSEQSKGGAKKLVKNHKVTWGLVR